MKASDPEFLDMVAELAVLYRPYNARHRVLRVKVLQEVKARRNQAAPPVKLRFLNVCLKKGKGKKYE